MDSPRPMLPPHFAPSDDEPTEEDASLGPTSPRPIPHLLAMALSIGIGALAAVALVAALWLLWLAP